MAVQVIGRDVTAGVQVAQTSSKVGFYGTTPIAKPTVTAVTDGSTGTAAATNGIAPATATYNSTIVNNAVATLADGVNRLRTALANLGIVA